MCSPLPLVAERYRLIRPLGHGGMGRVWQARDEVLDRDVAVKEVCPPRGLTRGERDSARDATLREARAAARLGHHPNVVRIYDAIYTGDRAWIVMEYVPSRSLHQVVNEDGPLPPRRAARIGLAVLAALRAAHRAGVLHRDVKPSNVLLAEDGRVVLTDFGLAIFAGGGGVVTHSEFVLGSPQYIAPERARDGVSSPESDLWSLGATLYAAVEGRSPYARATAAATLTALATEDPDPAPHAGALKPVLNALLRKNPRMRAGIDEVERLLLRAVSPERARVRNRMRSRTRAAAPVTGRHWVAAAAAIVVTLAGSAAALIAGDSQASVATQTATGSTGTVTAGANAPSGAGTPAGAVGQGGSVGQGASAGQGGSVGQGGSAASSADAPGTWVLPIGWVWYADVTGFRVAVPAGWTRSVEDGVVYFRDRTRGRTLAIAQADRPEPDPLTGLARQEMQRSDALPGYHRLTLAGVPDYWLACADWEYLYDGTSGSRLHVLDREFVTSPAKGYTIFWLTREADWRSSLSGFALVVRTFQPAAR